MSVQAFTVEGSLQKYDFNALENSPIAKGSGVGSLVVAHSDHPNVASGNGSFAGGAGSQATGLCSFAYGSYSPNYPSPVASGATAFSFGLGTESSGNYSVSLGYLAKAKATASFAIGRSVTANGAYSIALGKNNIEDTNPADSSGQRKYVFIVGNGTNSEPSNAMTVDWDGNIEAQGTLVLNKGKTNEIDILQAAINSYPMDLSYGEVASFPDGANNIPVKDLTVAIEPVQDLHGYGNPWPAGCGKNKLAFPYFESSKTNNGVTFTVNDDGTVRINGTATERSVFYLHAAGSNFHPNVGTYYVSKGSECQNATIIVEAYNGTTWIKNLATVGTAVSVQFTVDYDGYDRVSAYISVASGKSPSNEIIKPMIRLSSVSDETYAPYSNICPISGWMGCNVTRTGKNLFDESVMATANGWTEDNGVYTGSSDYLDRNVFGYLLTSLFPLNTQLTISFDINNETNKRAGYFYFQYSDGTQSYVECPANAAWVHKSLTTTAGKEITAFYFGKSNGTTFSLKNVQLEFGTSESLFEAYQGNTRSISWQSEAGTVYGGTLDVTSGLLTVNKIAISRAIANMDNQESYPGWKNVAELDALGLSTTQGAFTADAGNIGLKFSWNTNSANILFLGTGDYGKTQSQWQSEYPNLSVIFVCPLATPQTYMLTPVEVKTLLGVNNIWANTGASNVTYRADSTQYVDNAIPFTTPEMYGAKGDGLTDDTTALKTAFENGGVVFLRNGATYLVSDLTVENSENLTVIGYGATIKVKKEFEFISYIQRCCLKLENCTNVKFNGLTFDASWREIKEYHNLEVDTTMENYCVRLLEGNNGVTFYKCIFGNQLKVCLQTQGSYLGGDTSDPASIDSTFVPNKNIDIGYCTFGWNYEPGLHNGAIQMLELPQVATDVNVKIHDNLILKSGVHGMHIYYGNNNVIIENNVVLDSGHCVLEDYYAGGGTVVFGYGIEVTSCNKVTIKNNLVHNFIAGGICVFNDGWHTAGDIHDIFIESNVVEQEPAYSTEFRGHGILLGHADDGVISNNTCKSVYRTANVGSSISAICVSESNHAVVSGNIVFDCENGCFFNYTKDVSCEHNQIHALNNRQGNNVAFGAGFYSTENISCANNIFDLGSSTSTKFDGIMISTVVLAVLSGNVFNGLRYGIKDNSTSVTNATIFGSVFKAVSNKYVWWGTHTDLVVDFVAVPNN